MTTWHVGRMVGYDIESTGTDPLTARIVTAAIVHTTPGDRPRTIQWLLDPGIDIPAEAAAVHGWTRDSVLAEVGAPGRAVRLTDSNRMPMTVDGALGEIAGHLSLAMKAEAPVVVANAAYDMTLIERELTRVGVDTLTSRPSGIRGVVDPMCLEKQYDTYRRTCYKAPGCDHRAGIVNCTGCRGGKYRCGGCGAPDRKLGSLIQHYGLRLPRAHSAGDDALAAVRLAKRLAGLWPEVARLRLPTLYAHQVEWAAGQTASLQEYHERLGTAEGEYDQGWPVHSRLASQLAGVAS